MRWARAWRTCVNGRGSRLTPNQLSTFRRRVSELSRGHDRTGEVSAADLGAAALFRVRHLVLQDVGELLGRHARAPQYPLALNRPRGSHHHDRVAAPLVALLEEERDVEHDQAFAAVGCQELALRVAHHRMQDLFQPPELPLVGEDLGSERLPVEHAVLHGTGKGLRDRRDGPPVGRGQAMDGGVGNLRRWPSDRP